MMARTRDKLIHDYPGIDPHVVWRAIAEDLPAVRESVQRILSSL